MADREMRKNPAKDYVHDKVTDDDLSFMNSLGFEWAYDKDYLEHNDKIIDNIIDEEGERLDKLLKV